MKKNLLKLILSIVGIVLTSVNFACPITVALSESEASCYTSCDGEIVATVSGTISSTLVYQWKDSDNNTIGTNSDTLSGLCAGSYSVTVYDTATTSSQTYLLHTTFESGTTIPFTLNTSTLGGISPGVSDNLWIINNSYIGGTALSLPNTPQQNASISGSATSTYMHITNNAFISLGASNVTYLDASITSLGGQNGMNFTEMNTDVSTIRFNWCNNEFVLFMCRFNT